MGSPRTHLCPAGHLPLKGGDRTARHFRRPFSTLAVGDGRRAESPPLRGRCPAGQRGARGQAMARRLSMNRPHPRIRALRHRSRRRGRLLCRVIGLDCLAKPKAGTSSSAADDGVLLLFNAEATKKPPARREIADAAAWNSGQGHLCFAATAAEIAEWKARLEDKGIAIEADFEWPRRGPLDLFSRPVRQFDRIRRTAHLGHCMKDLSAKKIVVASHNDGKLREIADLMAPFGFEAKSAKEYGLPEPDETGTTFEENAYIKAHAAATATGLPALSDDSGLVIDALGGQPGVYTANWAETPRRHARFRHGHAARRSRHAGSRRSDARPAHGPVRRGHLPLLSRRRGRIFSRRGGRHAGLAAARRHGLRLRSGVPAERPRRTFGEMTAEQRSTAGARPGRQALSHRARASRNSPRARKLGIGHERTPGRSRQRTRLRRLHPLAVLRGQVPLLRLQQPCAPPAGRPGALCPAFEREMATMRARTGPREVTSIFLGGGTPSLMEPETVARCSTRWRGTGRCPPASR